MERVAVGSNALCSDSVLYSLEILQLADTVANNQISMLLPIHKGWRCRKSDVDPVERVAVGPNALLNGSVAQPLDILQLTVTVANDQVQVPILVPIHKGWRCRHPGNDPMERVAVGPNTLLKGFSAQPLEI